SSHAGDRVAIASQARVPFAVSYRLPSEATNVELVANGEVVAQKDLAGSGVWRPDVTIADSAWVLARCTTAHTGPIYVDVAGRPIRASVASARQFVRHVDRLLGELDEPGFSFGTPSDEERALIEVERQRAKATYEESRGIWQRLEEECRERERLLAR
ncbi:MAG: hypothetical protein JKY65_15935, partial [Planctomycetes bacterium]|nr:hypothetical protein [Planctomycetota bacterium]